MNNLLYSNIEEYYENKSNDNYYNFDNSKYNINLENLNYKYNENLLNQILLCDLSREYLKKKLIDNNLLIKIINKIINFERETLITLLIGMLIILLFINFSKLLIKLIN